MKTMSTSSSSSPPPRKIKVGVVGCGVVATAYYLPYLMRHADLVAVCDANEKRTAACVRLFGAKEQYLDYLLSPLIAAFN